MKNDFMSYEDALSELALGKNELNEIVAKGEIRAFHQGDEIRFKKDDIVALKKSRETEPTIVLSETRAESRHTRGAEKPIDLDTLSTEETVLNIEGLLEDDNEGTTPIPGTTAAVGEDTVLDTEGLELDGDFDLSKDETLLDDSEETLLAAGAGRRVQMVKKQSHGIMTACLVLTMVILLIPCAIILNMSTGPEGTYPSWITEYFSILNPAVQGIVGIFG